VLNGISAVYDFYFNGEARKKERKKNEKKSYIIERLETPTTREKEKIIFV
jgi:hypothetical protein